MEIIKLFSNLVVHSVRSFRNSIVVYCTWLFCLLGVYVDRYLKVPIFQNYIIATIGVRK